jgi:uncharacterized protein (AIM24 family)
VLRANGPIEVIDLRDERLATDGHYVLARTEGITYRVKRSARTLFGSFLMGERRLRLYEGTGRILLSSYPYWRQLLRGGDAAKDA